MSKAYKDVCPCKDCKERVVSCHGICKEYKKWKESGIEIEIKPPINYIDYSINNNKRKAKKK